MSIQRSDLELVLAVRDNGSLAAAAQSLNLAAPAVTKRLAALEARLGQRLFQRTTRRVSPTAEGEEICASAAPLLARFKTLEDQLQEKHTAPTGHIRLAATLGFGRLWLGPALARFQAQYPKLQVQLQLTEQLPDLAADGFDGAVWLWSIQGAQAAQWVSRRLARNQRVLVAAPDYLQKNGTPLTVADLAQHTCLIARENGSRINQSFDEWHLTRLSTSQKNSSNNNSKNNSGNSPEVCRAVVKGALSSNSGELVRDWCLDGHGIMLRSLWDIAPLLANGQLTRLLPDLCMPDADIHWLAPYRPDTPRRIRLLIDFLVAEFASEPWKTNAALSSLRRAPPSSRQAR